MPKANKKNAGKSSGKRASKNSATVTGDSRLRSGKLRFNPMEQKTPRNLPKSMEKSLPVTVEKENSIALRKRGEKPGHASILEIPTNIVEGEKSSIEVVEIEDTFGKEEIEKDEKPKIMREQKSKMKDNDEIEILKTIDTKEKKNGGTKANKNEGKFARNKNDKNVLKAIIEGERNDAKHRPITDQLDNSDCEIIVDMVEEETEINFKVKDMSAMRAKIFLQKTEEPRTTPLMEVVEHNKVSVFGDQEDRDSPNVLIIDEDRNDTPDEEWNNDCALDLSQKRVEFPPPQFQPLNLSLRKNTNRKWQFGPSFKANNVIGPLSSADEEIVRIQKEKYRTLTNTLWPVSPAAARASLGFSQPLFCNYNHNLSGTSQTTDQQTTTNLAALYGMNLLPQTTENGKTIQREATTIEQTSWESPRRLRVIRNPEELKLENAQEHPVTPIIPKPMRLEQSRRGIMQSPEIMVHSTVSFEPRRNAEPANYDDNPSQWSAKTARRNVDAVVPQSSICSYEAARRLFAEQPYLPGLRPTVEKSTYAKENGSIDETGRFLNFNSRGLPSTSDSTNSINIFGPKESTTESAISHYENSTVSLLRASTFSKNSTQISQGTKYATRGLCACGIPYCPGHEHIIPRPAIPQTQIQTSIVSESLDPMAHYYPSTFSLPKQPTENFAGNFYLPYTLERHF